MTHETPTLNWALLSLGPLARASNFSAQASKVTPGQLNFSAESESEVGVFS